MSEWLERHAQLAADGCQIDAELYEKHDVKRGLRDLQGRGVMAGLTNIADVVAYEKINGEKVPCEGRLYYRGYNVEQLISGFLADNRFGFEETVYLLLFGKLPSEEELADFYAELQHRRTLPRHFVRDVILKAANRDMMNTLARSVLTLNSYDKHPDDTSIPNLLEQSMMLIATLPMMAVYSYQSFEHYINHGSLVIHHPKKGLTTAQNILHLLRPDSKYTALEARVLDVALVLHAEHGGGNNSTFTTRVVTSSGTDTYSAIAAGLASLKGPRHGGANIKVVGMMDDIKRKVRHWDREEEVREYLVKIVRKQAFDNSGLIYGMGHAVYSLSDPRANVLKGFVEQLATEKGRKKEYNLYALIEKLAPEVIAQERKIYKGVAANIDFYSGFVYDMLDLPTPLYTPIFAIARIAGWCAHRIEEVICSNKITRPAYHCVAPVVDYLPLDER